MYRLNLEKAEGPEIKSPTSTGSQKKGIPKKSTSASLTMLKSLTMWITTNFGKFLEMGIPDHITCPQRNLYAGQEATIRTGHVQFEIWNGVHQVCVLSPCLFYSYAEYITPNAWLDEAQPGIKIAGRNINNLRYADDTTLMAESEEELKSLLMKVKEECKKKKNWLKT